MEFLSGYMGGVCDYNEEDTHKSATQRKQTQQEHYSKSIVEKLSSSRTNIYAFSVFDQC